MNVLRERRQDGTEIEELMLYALEFGRQFSERWKLPRQFFRGEDSAYASQRIGVPKVTLRSERII